jgi:localization factor PodJL
MTSRVSWSGDGDQPAVRVRADASTRHGGDWPPAHDLSEIHRRLDSITRQVEQITRPPGGNGDPMLAHQLNDAIARLDARLSQISADPARAEPRRPAAAAPPYRPSPPTSPALPPVDFSIAEIVARQGELDGLPPRPMPRRTAAQMPPPSYDGLPAYAPPPPDFSGLERQLAQITSQIETLRRPDPLEQSIAAFRGELTAIRQAITEAMPRHAIESLEGEIRSLGRRIDETRSTGADNSMLASIERALSDIYSELRTLKPAEQLAGFDEAIRNLGGKVDQIVRTSHDPGTLRQLEDAIAALKAIVANVASNEALNQLAEHVQALSAKVDQLAASQGNGDLLAALEQRITVLTTALEQRERPGTTDTGYFDNAVRAISDRLDHLQVGSDGAASLGHLEQRIHHLIERLDASRPDDSGGLARVEQGLSDILRHLEQQRINASAIDHGLRASSQMDGALVDTIKRELSDLRFSQSESVRHTQDSLETVHNTLGHVVDRLAQIERDLRDVRSAPPARDMRSPETRAPEPPRAATLTPPPRPELPNPAAAQAPLPRAEPTLAPSLAEIEIAPRQAENAGQAAAALRPHAPPRSPIDPSLPPDHPIEPGTRMAQPRGPSPAERIAASEGVLSEIAPASRDPVSSTNFIQAARRAAQAAAAATPAPAPGSKPNRVTALNTAARNAAKAVNTGESSVSAKIRAVLVGVSVVVIVLGTVRMGMNLLSGHDSASTPPAAESSSATPPAAPPVADPGPRSEATPPAMPSITSPTPLDRQPLNAQSAMPTLPAEAPAAPDVTGSIISAPESSPAPAPAKTKPRAALVPVTDPIPESIGAAALRTAAAKGDPGAAFEIGVRYAEGRGVAPDLAEAAKWYERAARGGIVPASFRLGTLHEKGLGTRKDSEAARRHYLEAAEKGNAKAMHNLAVLDADGGNVGPNYKSAAQWFRKAAERGVADSQFNLGILYARGIGVEQNLAESYKWFSLAAAQGDADSGRKRDDVAKRLDAQSLAAAKLAAQTFTAEPQPDEATSVGAPAGGWDSAPAKTAAKSSASRSAAAKPTSKNAAR